MKYNNTKEWEAFKSGKQARLNQMNFDEMGNLVGKLENKEVRMWYKAHDGKIPDLIDRTQSLEQQARQACELRNNNRSNARELMEDQAYRRRLDKERPNRAFEYYYNKYKADGKTDVEVYKTIIYKSTQTNKDYDRKAELISENLH